MAATGTQSATSATPSLRRRREVIRTGALLGIGLAGLADGVIFHQVLQWHHLVSDDVPADTVSGLETNTLADGVFHLVSIGILVAGIVALSRVHAQASARRLGAGILVGWGTFHLLDEVVFHLLLDLHHIRQVENYLVYDLAYTAAGIALVAAGIGLLRRDARMPEGPEGG